MGIADRFGGWLDGLWPQPEEQRSTDLSLSFDSWAQMLSTFAYNGLTYTLPGATQEDVGNSYTGMARGALKSDGVVFACMFSRMALFSEARFAYRRRRTGRPGDIFTINNPSNPLAAELELLRNPWPGATTGDLLSRMIQHVDIAGNAYVVRRNNMLTPLRPDWVSIIGGVQGVEDATVWHPDAEVLGYAYQEGGPSEHKDPVFFLPEEVAHFAPIPDPEARFRGMSWLSPVAREIMGDKAATDHKLAFFENGATPNLAVTLNVDSLAKYREWMEELTNKHEGVQNAYKTLFLASGADAKVLGIDMQQLDFKVVQGAGETRIAAAAGIHPVIVGLSEGLQGSSLNAGNFNAARRLTADRTLRPLWSNVCGSLANIIRVPSDAELWYDSRDISFLQEDEQDAANIFAVDAQSFRTLVDGGVDPDSAKAAVAARDISQVQHTGLLSVQLHEQGATPRLPAASTPKQLPPGRGRRDPLEMIERELIDRATQNAFEEHALEA